MTSDAFTKGIQTGSITGALASRYCASLTNDSGLFDVIFLVCLMGTALSSQCLGVMGLKTRAWFGAAWIVVCMALPVLRR